MSLFTPKELSRFSVTKALAEVSNQVWKGADGDLTGLEREASDALKSDFVDTPPSLAIPCLNPAILASCFSTCGVRGVISVMSKTSGFSDGTAHCD